MTKLATKRRSVDLNKDTMAFGRTCECITGCHDVGKHLGNEKQTFEAFSTRRTESSERGGVKSRKTFKKPNEFKDYSDGCIDTWVEVARLHLEQDNLNDERQACIAILINLEGTALKFVVAKKEKRDTVDRIFQIASDPE